MSRRRTARIGLVGSILVVSVALAAATSAGCAAGGGASAGDSTRQAAAESPDQRRRPEQNDLEEPRTTSECDGVVQQTVDLVNERRSQHNAGPVTCDPKAGRAAAIHAEDLCRHGRFSHTGSDGSSMVDRARRIDLEFRTLAENIAKGQQTAEAVVREWMNSRGHRKNILNDDFDRVGIAKTRCPNDQPIWVQVFAG